MKITIKVEGDRIVDAKFKTFGCGAAIAVSSMVTEMVKGKTLDEALSISKEAVANELGGLPPQKMHCSNLGSDALKMAIEDYKGKARGGGAKEAAAPPAAGAAEVPAKGARAKKAPAKAPAKKKAKKG
jgi:nitrogen fixation NifU-like protein